MPVSESYGEADGALMPGLAFKQGAIARVGHGEVKSGRPCHRSISATS